MTWLDDMIQLSFCTLMNANAFLSIFYFAIYLLLEPSILKDLKWFAGCYALIKFINSYFFLAVCELLWAWMLFILIDSEMFGIDFWVVFSVCPPEGDISWNIIQLIQPPPFPCVKLISTRRIKQFLTNMPKNAINLSLFFYFNCLPKQNIIYKSWLTWQAAQSAHAQP